MKTRLLIIVYLVFALVLGAFAQADQVVTLPDGTKVLLRADKTWKPLPSDPPPAASTSSTAKIVGDDIRDVATAFLSVRKQFDKSEFETEAQYIDRIQKLEVTVKITSKNPTGHTLAETVLIFQNLAKYDAERQQFRFSSYDLPSSIQLVKRDSGFWMPMPHYEILGGMEPPEVKMLAADAAKVKSALALAIYAVPVSMESAYTIQMIPSRMVAFNVATGEIYGETVRK